MGVACLISVQDMEQTKQYFQVLAEVVDLDMEQMREMNYRLLDYLYHLFFQL